MGRLLRSTKFKVERLLSLLSIKILCFLPLAHSSIDYDFELHVDQASSEPRLNHFG